MQTFHKEHVRIAKRYAYADWGGKTFFLSCGGVGEPAMGARTAAGEKPLSGKWTADIRRRPVKLSVNQPSN
jgi:hypothetical protein